MYNHFFEPITFDYRVPEDENDPEAVTLRVDGELQVTRSRSSSDRARIITQVIRAWGLERVVLTARRG